MFPEERIVHIEDDTENSEQTELELEIEAAAIGNEHHENSAEVRDLIFVCLFSVFNHIGNINHCEKNNNFRYYLNSAVCVYVCVYVCLCDYRHTCRRAYI